MTIIYYKDEDGKVSAEDTILDDLSEMIREETNHELDEEQVADLAVKMLEDMVKDGSLKKVKSFNECDDCGCEECEDCDKDETIEEAEEPHKAEYEFTPEDYEDWVDLKPNSMIVKKIEDWIEEIQDDVETQVEEYWRHQGDPDHEYDVNYVDTNLGALDIDKYVDWIKDFDIDDFHTDHLLSQGKQGLQDVLDLMKDYQYGDDLAYFIGDYRRICDPDEANRNYRYMKTTRRHWNDRYSGNVY